MELVLVVFGGTALGLFLIWRNRTHPRNQHPDPFERDGLSIDVMNYARFRAAGVGGLGLIAMALAVAWVVPRIGQTLAVGLVLGVGVAAIMILARRRSGALPSSGRRPGANTTLSIDAPPDPQEVYTPPDHDWSEP